MRVLNIVNGQSAASDATSTPVDIENQAFPFQQGGSALAVFNSDGLAGSTVYLEGNNETANMASGNTTLASFAVAEAPAKIAEVTLYRYMRVRVDEATSTGAGVVSVNLIQN